MNPRLVELRASSFDRVVEQLRQALREAGFAQVLQLDADLARYVEAETGLPVARCTVLMATGSIRPERPRLQTRALVVETGAGALFLQLSDPTTEVAKTSCAAVQRVARSTRRALEQVVRAVTTSTPARAVA